MIALILPLAFAKISLLDFGVSVTASRLLLIMAKWLLRTVYVVDIICNRTIELYFFLNNVRLVSFTGIMNNNRSYLKF